MKTDHQPLRWLLTMKCPVGRLARWALQIQQYNFKIIYVAGKSNPVADMLSRPTDVEPEVTNILQFQIDFPHKSIAVAREEQMKDAFIADIINSIETTVHRWINRGYILNDGVLYCYNDDDSDEAQLVIPEHERGSILNLYHDSDLNIGFSYPYAG